MRSITFTLLLAILAATVCGVIGWRMREGNLDSIFGTPPTPPGATLYQNIPISEVARISVSSQGIRGEFTKTPTGWRSDAAPHDRMDPRYATAIIAFTLNLRVLDSVPADEIDRDEVGLRDDSVQIRLESTSGTELAHYRMGRRTPLQSENTQTGIPDASVYIRPRERDRRDHVYACTGDISPLFRDGLKFLRDHRPFFINPSFLQKIRIRHKEGELTLGHAEPGDKAPWRIEKPLDLSTERASMLALLNGLVELGATKLSDRSAVTLPRAETATRSLQIGITPFGSSTEILLDVYPPETPDATETLATVSDRPETVFHLPIKPGPGSLANLPVSVNELRNRSLTNIDISELRTITLTPSTGQKLVIFREAPKPWQVEVNGRVQDANEQRLFALLKALTETKAIGFEGDAVTDFTPWGLSRPVLGIELAGAGDQTLKLNFGIDGKGGLFVNRAGTSSVASIDPKVLSSFSIRPYEWRLARLWSISAADLKGLIRTVRTDPPLELGYDDFDERWTGRIAGADVSDRINPSRAKYLLDSISGLNVSRWLASDDAEAAAALAAPVFTLTVIERVVDDFGDDAGEKRRTLTLAPIPDDTSYYGRMNEEPHAFLLDRETVLKIATDPLEN